MNQDFISFVSNLIWIGLQNNGGLISFSVEEAEEEKEEEEVKAKEKTSGNILVVETDFERMPRRSSFRSKERRELTRCLSDTLGTAFQKCSLNGSKETLI